MELGVIYELYNHIIKTWDFKRMRSKESEI